MAWPRGEVIVHREVWRGVPWCVCAVVVVEDTPELLVTYLPEEAPFAFPPSADGRPHPWAGKQAWDGHGVLMLRRPGEAYSVWHFWAGPDRAFAGWYLNLEEPIRRTADRLRHPGPRARRLDPGTASRGASRTRSSLDERVREGRYTDEQVDAIRALGDEIGAMLDRGERWWDERWASFEPDPAWRAPAFPAGWEEAPVAPAPPPSAYRALPCS